MKTRYTSLVLHITLQLISCSSELRGEVEKSSDGNKYLIFKNGCDSIYVNDSLWPHKLTKKAKFLQEPATYNVVEQTMV